ncbi:hypothetical protein D3C76_1631750 [compost metagenome]
MRKRHGDDRAADQDVANPVHSDARTENLKHHRHGPNEIAVQFSHIHQAQHAPGPLKEQRADAFGDINRSVHKRHLPHRPALNDGNPGEHHP